MSDASKALRAFHPVWPNGCWPNEVQKLLLIACLSVQEGIAQEAFREWSENIRLFVIDSGSHSLLPMLYERLRKWGLLYQDMPRLQGIARYFWVRHQSQRHELLVLADVFAKAGIEILLLKGAALNATAYSGTTRTMADIDIAVRRRDAVVARNLLQKHGWKAGLRPAHERVLHGCPYYRGEMQVDLHWDFLHSRPLDDNEQAVFWLSADKININGTIVRSLCPADQILHISEHGMRMNETAPFRWLADACLIVRRGGIDWQRLAMLAERFDLIEPVRRTLSYVETVLNEPIPQVAREALKARRSALSSRFEFFIKTRRMPGSHPFWFNLPAHVFDYWRVRRLTPGLSIGEYLWLVNDFHTPLRTNLKRLVQLEAMNAFQATANLCNRGIAALQGKQAALRMSVFTKDIWEGFSAPEITNFGVLRWSQAHAGIWLPLQRHHRAIKLQLAPARSWYGDLDKCLSFRLNEHLIDARHVRFDKWIVSLDLELDMIADGEFRRLEIRCKPWIESHSDTRALGVPVKSVELIEVAE